MAVDKIVLQYEADITQLKAKMSQLETSFGKQEAHLKKVNTEVSNVSKNIGGGLGGALSKIGPMIAATFSVQAVIAFGKAAIEGAAKMEQLRVSFTTMLGSAEKAGKLLEQITQFAASTPFELNEVADASKKLLAFGVEANKIIPTLKAVGDVAAGIGAPLGEIAEIYGKAKTQGRLFAEDINQLTGRGIPIIQELAKQFNTTESNVKKLVENGQIGFEQLEIAFQNLSGEGGKFANLMDAQSKTVTGSWSNLKDNFNQMLTSMGQAFEPFTKMVLSATNELFYGLSTAFKGETFDTQAVKMVGSIGKQLRESKTKQEVDIIITTLENARSHVKEGGLAWNTYTDAIRQATKFSEKLQVANENVIPKILPPTLETLTAKLKGLKEQYDKAAIGSAEFNRLGNEIIKTEDQIAVATGKVTDNMKAQNFERERQKRLKEGELEKVDVELSNVDVKNTPEGIKEIKLEKLREDAADLHDKLEEKKTKKTEEETEKRKQLEQEVISSGIELMNLGFELNKTINEAELTDLESKKEKGLITEKEYNRQVAEIKLKQAKADQAQALFGVGIQTALNVTKAFPNPLLIALAVAMGALQAAAILSKPLPEVPAFAKGVVGYKGKGTFTSDENLVKISNQESIITAKSTIAKRAELEALNEGPDKFDRLIAYKYIAPALKRYEQNRRRSTAENMANSMKLQAVFNDRNMVNAIRGNKTVEFGTRSINTLAKKIKSQPVKMSNL